MKSNLIFFDTKDGAKISGIMYSKSKKKKIVILVHGACMNYLEGISYFIPARTTSYEEYDFLSINMRAHDLGYIVNQYDLKEGWAWQSIEKNRFDIEAVFSYLVKEGYSDIILCGHSWGGLVCLDYLKHTQNSTCNKLILLSPTVSYKLLVEVNYRNNIDQALIQAKKMMDDGFENGIITTDINSPIPFMSAKTIYDFMTYEFEAKDYLDSVTKSVDIIIGGLEHKKLQEFSRNLSQNNKLIHSHVIKKSNHFYLGHEAELVNLIDLILNNNS